MMSPYVISLTLTLSLGTMCRGMKKIVSVPFVWLGIPCASRPSLFPYEWVQVALVLGFAMRCRYSSSLPFSPIMELTFHIAKLLGIFDLPSFVPMVRMLVSLCN